MGSEMCIRDRLGVKFAQGEEAAARLDLGSLAVTAAEKFINLPHVVQLRRERFDVVLVDAGSLAAHLLVDSMQPQPHVHFLCYPYLPNSAPRAKGERRALEEAAADYGGPGERLHALRASVGCPPKQECTRWHRRTIVGHSAAMHHNATAPIPRIMTCTGSVLAPGSALALPADLAAWAAAAGARQC